MKIVAINGSHKGRHGNTDIMVAAFLKGAQGAGAETVNAYLAENVINFCRACKACWFEKAGQCIIKDDMAKLLLLLEGADVWVWATPLYFDNISSMMKTFIDRLMVSGNPYWVKDKDGEYRHLTKKEIPKLMLIANCGFPERSHFQVISHWIKRHARGLGTEVIGEIYASQGALLGSATAELKPVIGDYLRTLETAGREIAADMALSAKTKAALGKSFIPNEIYSQGAKKYVDELLQKR